MHVVYVVEVNGADIAVDRSREGARAAAIRPGKPGDLVRVHTGELDAFRHVMVEGETVLEYDWKNRPQRREA